MVVRVRVVRPFRRLGEHVEPGTVLELEEWEAGRLVHGYGYAVVESEAAPPPPAAMVTHADPAPQVRDPVVVKPGRRRG